MEHRLFHKACTWLDDSRLYCSIMYRLESVDRLFDAVQKVKEKVKDNKLAYVICDECMDYLEPFRNSDFNDVEDMLYILDNPSKCDVVGIKNGWHSIFNDVCYHFSFNKNNAYMLWKNLCEGNWEHLHQTDEEKSKDAAWWFNRFCGEVFYCSDRWSMDRLMRCHWLHRQWLYAEWDELENCNVGEWDWYLP